MNSINQRILNSVGLEELQSLLQSEFAALLELLDKCAVLAEIELDATFLYSILPEPWKIQLGIVLLPEPVEMIQIGPRLNALDDSYYFADDSRRHTQAQHLDTHVSDFQTRDMFPQISLRNDESSINSMNDSLVS